MGFCKKISIILFFVFFIFLFSNNCEATDVTFQYNNQDVTITGINNPYTSLAIFIDTNTGYSYNMYYIYSWDSTTSKLLYNESSGYSHFRCIDTTNNDIYYYWTFARSDRLDITGRTFNQRIGSYTPGSPQYFVYTNTDIYDYDNSNTVLYPSQDVPQIQDPIIYNKSEISQASFDNVVIEINDYDIEEDLYLTLIYNPVNTGTTGNNEIAYYYQASSILLNYSSSYYISNYNEEPFYIIPKNELNLLPNTQYIMILSTQKELFYNTIGIYNYENDPNALDGVTFNTGQTITSQDVTNNEINNQTDVINNQTNAINNQTNTLTDDTVSTTPNDLPSVSVNDITANGIDNIFTSIYNAFCVGTPQDIIFPIPFTNRNITLSPYYLSNMLSNYGLSWLLIFIQAFWSYLIGSFIVKDISHKINKIKSGNIENLQNDNIKEEML